MTLSFLKSKPALQHIVFGKLPTQPDFIRFNAAHPAASELDGYLQEALHGLSLESDWTTCFDQSGATDFVMSTRDQRYTLVGSLVASQDATGRRYPMVAATALNGVLDENGALLLAGENFFHQLRSQLEHREDTSAGVSLQALLEAHEGAWADVASNVSLARQVVERFMVQNHPKALEKVFDTEKTGQTLYQTVLNILFYRDFLVDFQSSSTLQVIEIPLQDAPGECPLWAGVWLSLMAPLARFPGLDLLIQHAPASDISFNVKSRAILRFTFGRNMGRLLTQTFGGHGDSQSVLDLLHEQNVWKSHPLYPQTAYALQRLLDDPASTVRELSDFMDQVSKKMASIHS